MNKWPTHIEKCLEASYEHGPDARFICNEIAGKSSIRTVLTYDDLNWKVAPPPKPDVEQWGNEYADMGRRIQFQLSRELANKHRASGCIAIHHRIVDGESGMTKFFATLEVRGSPECNSLW